MISCACLSVDFGKVKNGVNIFLIDLLKCQEREREPGKPFKEQLPTKLMTISSVTSQMKAGLNKGVTV